MLRRLAVLLALAPLTSVLAIAPAPAEDKPAKLHHRTLTIASGTAGLGCWRSHSASAAFARSG